MQGLGKHKFLRHARRPSDSTLESLLQLQSLQSCQQQRQRVRYASLLLPYLKMIASQKTFSLRGSDLQASAMRTQKRGGWSGLSVCDGRVQPRSIWLHIVQAFACPCLRQHEMQLPPVIPRFSKPRIGFVTQGGGDDVSKLLKWGRPSRYFLEKAGFRVGMKAARSRLCSISGTASELCKGLAMFSQSNFKLA